MTRRRFFILLIIIVSAVILAAYLSDRRESPKEVELRKLEQVIERYRQAGYLGYTGTGFVGFDRLYLENCLKLLKDRYGKYLDGVNINGPLQSNSINIYFFDRDPEGMLVPFKGNCASVGHKNIIICDLSYVAEWQTFLTEVKDSEWKGSGAPGLTPRQMSQIARAVRANFLIWLLGHEIGHIAHEHHKRHYAFNYDQADVLIQNFDGRGSREEEQADEFMVEAASGGIAGVLYLTLSTVIMEFKNKYQQEQNLSPTFPNNGEKIILKVRSTTHPPFLLRAVNVWLLLNKRYDLESNTLGGKLHFEILKEHLTIGR